MTVPAITHDDHLARLQQRCEQQRQQLNQHFAAIETQLQTADMMASTIARTIKRPELWLSALAGTWAIRQSIQRIGLWSLISRGWMIWSVARRLMQWFKNSRD